MAISKQNFFSAHWDWLAAFVGFAALAASAVFYVQAIGESPEDAAAAIAAESRAQLAHPENEGVAPVAMDDLQKVLRALKAPPALRELDAKKASWLASERRVFCVKADPNDNDKVCARPIPAGLDVCPFCGKKQKVVVINLDADGDGLPNDWEKKYGFNPNDPADANQDADGDGFTNAEEFAAKTDPRNANAHPEYLDYLKVSGAVRQKLLPFWLKEANPIPGNTFRLTLVRTDTTKMWESNLRVKVGDAVKSADGKYDSGYVLESFEKKMVDEVIKGARDKAKRKVDKSVATFVRVKDGMKIKAMIGARSIPVEIEADMQWDREGGKNVTVHVGTEFELHKGRMYKVQSITQGKDGCEIKVLDLRTKKERIIR